MADLSSWLGGEYRVASPITDISELDAADLLALESAVVDSSDAH